MGRRELMCHMEAFKRFKEIDVKHCTECLLNCATHSRHGPGVL